jgi:hypothetical protein
MQLNGWNSMTLIGEVFFVQPFLWLAGGADWAFTAGTATLACVGIASAYALVRRVLSVWASTLSVLGVLIFPGFVINTTTYMTDVPTWAMAVTCLALGAVALSRAGTGRWVWLAGSLAVGCFGFSIREFAVAAPVAVLVVAAFSGMGRQRGYWVAVVLTAVACAAIYLYATHLPGRGGTDIGPPDVSISALRRAFDNSLRHGVASVCLVASPALVVAIAAWWRRWRPLDAVVGSVVASVFVLGPVLQIVRTGQWPQIVAGNLIGVGGSLDTRALYGTRPVLFADPWWHLINGGAIVAVLVAGAVCGGAVGAFIRSARSARRVPGDNSGHGSGGGRRGGSAVAARLRSSLRPWTGPTWALIVVFVVLYGVGIAGWSMAYTFFDRYIWAVVLPLYAILLRPPAALATEADGPRPEGGGALHTGAAAGLRRWTAPALAAVLVVGLASTSLILLGNSNAFAAARWNMGTAATELGTPADEVDAGFEWVAWNATGSALRQPPPAFGTGYESWWPSFHLCALVSTSPVNDLRATLVKVDQQAYRLMGFAGPWEPLYLYNVPGSGCP